MPPGCIDVVFDGHLHGWYGGPSGSRLLVRADGRLLGTTRNDRPRDDVVAAGLATGPVGFQFRLPEALLDGEEHAFEVVAEADAADGEALRRRLPVPVRHASPAGRDGTATGRRAAVVCWDLGHNPAGRALVLCQLLGRSYAQVDLIGPLFPRFGGRLWAPLEGLDGFRVVARRLEGFDELQRFAEETAARTRYDFVHMCKPRWPTLAIGMSLVRRSGCAFALDIDDDELAFFGEGEAQAADPAATLERLRRGDATLIDREATQLAHAAIPSMPLLTVSNVALQRRHGGTIIRHARDETVFDPARLVRARMRLAFGYGASEKVVLFLGTIRRHKGVVAIAEAIAGLPRDDLRLCLVGPVTEPALVEELRGLLGDRLALHEGVPFSRLAATVSIADLVCLPQDVGSAVSHFQIPAKLTDALAMGVPVIVEDLEPFSDLHGLPGIVPRRDEPLGAAIERALAPPRLAPERIRRGFLAEFSLQANAERLDAAMLRARRLDQGQVEAIARMVLGAPEGGPATARLAAPTPLRRAGRDLVFLWKQNDSGLFGRRSDMVARHLVRSGFAGRILHFDASVPLARFEGLRAASEESPLGAEGLVYRNTLARHLGLQHDLRTLRFTEIHDERRRELFGTRLPRASELPDRLRRLFRAQHLSAEALLWVCPVAFDFEAFTEAQEFPHIVADIIDDQRAFDMSEGHRQRIEANYRTVLGRADTVFANCDGVAERFRDHAAAPIHVVPNASERLRREEIEPIDLFAGEAVFRIGYVGNMRDRIDVDLLARIARHAPSWRLVLVGPTGGRRDIEALARLSNVVLLGAQRYEDACAIAAGFDAAIVPHLANELTDSMNPLKLYMYRALGLPVVTTPVRNLTVDGPFLRVAPAGEAFLAALEAIEALGPALRRDAAGPLAEDLAGDTWEDRVRAMAAILEGRAAPRALPAWSRMEAEAARAPVIA